MADDSCKEFALQQEKYMIDYNKTKYRNKPNRWDYGYSNPVSLRWFPLFQTLLQGICLQTSDTPFSASSFL